MLYNFIGGYDLTETNVTSQVVCSLTLRIIENMHCTAQDNEAKTVVSDCYAIFRYISLVSRPGSVIDECANA